MTAIPLLTDGPQDARTCLVLAHGAGAPMDSPFMQVIAQGLAAAGHRVVRFEFPYMHARRGSGRAPGPDRTPVLLDTYRAVIAQVGKPSDLFIGGKSMGGRVASMLADELGVRGLVCLGYPFHPAGKPTQLRTAHLAKLATPTLIVQGTRDTLGSQQDVASYALSPRIELVWLEDGDHSFSPRKRSGRTEAQALQEALAAIDRFMHATAART